MVPLSNFKSWLTLEIRGLLKKRGWGETASPRTSTRSRSATDTEIEDPSGKNTTDIGVAAVEEV